MARSSDVAEKDRKDELVEKEDITATLATEGKAALPGGKLEKWGSVTLNSGDTVTFPTAFPTATLNIEATPQTSGGTNMGNYGVEPVDETGFKIYHDGGGTRSFYWRAIGH